MKRNNYGSIGVLAASAQITIILLSACSAAKVTAGDSVNTQVLANSTSSPVPKIATKINPATDLETITFTAEKKTVVLQGKLEKAGAHMVYVLDLSKDQLAKDHVLYAQLSSPKNNIGFTVFDPKGKNIGSPGDYTWDWEDEISVQGTYRIDVSAMKGTGSFKLKVMLKKELRQD